MLQGKEQRLAEKERLQIFAEYQKDYERQLEVKEIDDRLEYLIAINNFCKQVLKALKY